MTISPHYSKYTCVCMHVFICLFICDQLENVGETLRESKRSTPTANELSSRSKPERSFVMETSHNGYENNNLTTMYNCVCGKFTSGLCCVCVCRLLEEYLDSKRLLSPVSPLSDSPDTNKPPSKTKTSEHNHLHAHVKVIQQAPI